MTDVGAVERLATEADVLFSICPPASAVDVADEVSRSGFNGIYVDANAIAPATAVAIGERFSSFVDAGIIGPPPRQPGDTRLYLSGGESAQIAELFAGSILETRIVSNKAGAASAMKMAYAAWTKGSTALLLSVAALAEAEGLRDELESEWEVSIPGLADRVENTVAGIGAKAWRFEGEMREIAATYRAAGLPGGFHEAAAELYARLAVLKGEANPAERVLELLIAERIE